MGSQALPGFDADSIAAMTGQRDAPSAPPPTRGGGGGAAGAAAAAAATTAGREGQPAEEAEGLLRQVKSMRC